MPHRRSWRERSRGVITKWIWDKHSRPDKKSGFGFIRVICLEDDSLLEETGCIPNPLPHIYVNSRALAGTAAGGAIERGGSPIGYLVDFNITAVWEGPLKGRYLAVLISNPEYALSYISEYSELAEDSLAIGAN